MVTTKQAIRKLHAAFGKLEDSYVAVETVCRESDDLEDWRAQSVMDAMKASHTQLRILLGELERRQENEGGR